MRRRREIRRMTPEEVRAYWRAHEERFAGVDWDSDPEGLSAYLGPGQPEWLNRRYDRRQREVFDGLLARVPPPSPGDRALDFGCGSARWTRRLADAGYAAVGVDVQERIVEENRRRHPDLEFHAGFLHELELEAGFRLVSSVGVLQVIPYGEQPDVLRRLADLVVPGGHAIVLEAVEHRAPNAFPHSPGDWAALFAGAGFTVVEEVPYHYEPLRRMLSAAVRSVAPSAMLTPDVPTDAPEEAADGGTSRGRRRERVLQAVAAADDRLEPALRRVRTPLVARWSGFLLRRP